MITPFSITFGSRGGHCFVTILVLPPLYDWMEMPRYAAVDIGSNSVKLKVAEVRPGSPVETLVDSREVTRLGTGVFRSGFIEESAMDHMADVLARLGEVIQKHDATTVRAVATSAVRDASNGAEFVARASASLGSKVEIISGQEEARLIYLGVDSTWPQPDGRSMIIDVGGGSAEIIIGENRHMVNGISRPLGAVRLTEMFLHSDPPTPSEAMQLNHFIDEKLGVVLRLIGSQEVTRVVGTSATAAALVCAIHGIPRSKRSEADRLSVSATQVHDLARELASMSLASRRKVDGIGPRRAEIIVAGAAVYSRILKAFRLPTLSHSAAGLRDGIIADLTARGVGREFTHLTPEQTQVVDALAQRFGVSIQHGKRVAALAHHLFEALQPLHCLPANTGKLLEAAACLIDTGHYISNVSHHKHSAYIVENADLPGFTEQERRLIALLCRYHRKAMPSARHQAFQDLGVDAKRTILYLTPLIRIADSLLGDLDHDVSDLQLEVFGDKVRITVVSDDPSLDLWAAEQAAKVFRDVYGIGITYHSKRGISAA